MELVKTGSRGRVTLGEKVATEPYYEVTKDEDGTITLHPVNITRANAQVFEESSNAIGAQLTREDITEAVDDARGDL
ncbi:hypothetical protein ACIBFB_01175 [Nocardiopsis sp. NPDC050513]|uniref:hypothetical protein n=1 Tax=Nocardiopsis sp. NPDC050513 TaxID=3364338 RepID=UPI00379B5633